MPIEMKRIVPTAPSSLVALIGAVSVAAAIRAPAIGGGTQKTWDGDCQTSDWSSFCVVRKLPDSNWTGGDYPDLLTDAVIPQEAPIVSVTTMALVKSLICDSGLQLVGGPQLKHGSGTSFIVGLHMQGSSGGGIYFQTPGEINLQNSATWLSGRVDGAGEVIVLGNLNPTFSVQAMSVDLQNGAAWRNDPGSSARMRFITIGPGCQYENRAGASLTLHSGPTIDGLINGGNLFVNAGDCTVRHEAANSMIIDAIVLMTGGTLTVEGVSGGVGTILTRSGSFTGGSIAVNDNVNLKFQSGAVPLPYVIDGLASIGGDGNARIEISSSHDFQVLAPLAVDLSGSDGFVIGSGHLTLGAALTNAGTARWSGGDIRASSCTECDPRFINSSPSFVIDTSGSVTLNTTFQNDGTVHQSLGSLSLQGNAEFVNNGEYILTRGNIQHPTNPVGDVFVNAGVLRKPDSAATADSNVTVPFVHGTGAQLVVEKAALQFTGGSSLTMEGGSVLVSAPGVLSFGTGDQVCATGTDTTVSGDGRFVVAASGANRGIRIDDGATLTLALSGTGTNGFHLASGGHIGGDGLAANVGNFHWEPGGVVGTDVGGGEFTGTFVNQAQAFATGGIVQGATSSYVNEAGATTTHTNGTISVQTVGARIVNRGTWREAPVPFASTTIQGAGTLVNEKEGTIVNEGNDQSLFSLLTVSAPFENYGTVHVKEGGAVTIAGPLLGYGNGEITLGTWIVDPGGSLLFPNAALVFAIGEGASITGRDGAFNPNFKPTVNEGTLRANGDWSCPSSFGNGGSVTIEDGTFTCPGDFTNDGGTCTLEQGATCDIEGDLLNIGDGATIRCDGGECDVNGDIRNEGGEAGALSYADDYLLPADSRGDPTFGGFRCTTFVNASRVRPGGPDGAGPFTITGDLVQQSSGGVEIDLGGPTPIVEHDQVRVTGNVSLAGSLIVRLLPGFAPRGGEQFTVLTVADGTLTGEFDEVVAIDGGTFSLAYASDAVVLTLVTVPVLGDLDGDGLVGPVDLGMLLGAWGSCGECLADLNDDGVVSAADLAVLLGAWS